MFSQVFNKLKKWFLILIGLLRRAMCCMRRTRSRKNSGMLLPVTNPAKMADAGSEELMAANTTNQPSGYSASQYSTGYTASGANPAHYTGFGSHNFQEYQQQQQAAQVSGQPDPRAPQSSHRSSLTNQSIITNQSAGGQPDKSSPQPAPQEQDLFAELAPKIKKQRKILVKTPSVSSNHQVNGTPSGQDSPTKKRSSMFDYDQQAASSASLDFQHVGTELGEIDDRQWWEREDGFRNAAAPGVSSAAGCGPGEGPQYQQAYSPHSPQEASHCWDVDDDEVNPEATLAQVRQAERERRLAEHRRLKEAKLQQQGGAASARKQSGLAATKIS